MKRRTQTIFTLMLAALLLLTACQSAPAQQTQSASAAEPAASPAQTAPEAEPAAEETAAPVAEPTAEPIAESDKKDVVLPKTPFVNPLVTDNYCGDPAILVDGDTVYLYVGHDAAKVEDTGYVMPDYLCYSSKDLQNWTYEGVALSLINGDVTWADRNSAWASQVAKYNGKYYLYFCSWDKTSEGKQSIGVAVSDSPVGPFVDLGEPLVRGTATEPETSGWNDIDPTVWIETDESGVEHRYLAWGNGLFYVCELNEDMVSVKDRNGDGAITCGGIGSGADIINQQTGLNAFTEAPWLYRRRDENGKAYGPYYLFYAYGWREEMAYATTDSLMDGTWTFGKILMPPTATSNTNHMAVFDYKGETYFVYHNGSLPAGHGFRRSPCITEVDFEDDGSLEVIPETAAGPWGETVEITQGEDGILTHWLLRNSSNDGNYPYLDVELAMEEEEDERNSEWVLCRGKFNPERDSYLSIQSENKPGLYITAQADGMLVLAQDSDLTLDTAKAQTFRSVAALDGSDGVSFESVSQPKTFITVVKGELKLTDGSDAAAASFEIDD